MKQTNKTVDLVAESAEGRPLAKRNSRELVGGRTPTTSRLAAVREAARAEPALVFTNPMTHLTPALLKESFYALDWRAAPESDNVGWQDYQEGLDDRLRALHQRIREGRYRPRPAGGWRFQRTMAPNGFSASCA